MALGASAIVKDQILHLFGHEHLEAIYALASATFGLRQAKGLRVLVGADEAQSRHLGKADGVLQPHPRIVESFLLLCIVPRAEAVPVPGESMLLHGVIYACHLKEHPRMKKAVVSHPHDGLFLLVEGVSASYAFPSHCT